MQMHNSIYLHLYAMSDQGSLLMVVGDLVAAMVAEMVPKIVEMVVKLDSLTVEILAVQWV